MDQKPLEKLVLTDILGNVHHERRHLQRKKSSKKKFQRKTAQKKKKKSPKKCTSRKRVLNKRIMIVLYRSPQVYTEDKYQSSRPNEYEKDFKKKKGQDGPGSLT